MLIMFSKPYKITSFNWFLLMKDLLLFHASDLNYKVRTKTI
jgi:hypothetical protein